MRVFFEKKKAIEIIGVEDKGWINSEPLSLEKLKGKVILLDFWTYSCVNCLRTLPALKELWAKYKDKRFVIIGIHTPEFEFEKEIGNVKYAVKKHGIKYPVANDPEKRNWHNYGNRYWPRAALVDSEGRVIFEHVGEGGYDEIEDKIIEELRRIKELGELNIKRIKEEKRKYEPLISREIYAGSERNEGINSRTVCAPDGCDEYILPREYKKDAISLQGKWNQEPEYLDFIGEDGWIILKYCASEVNVVMAGNGMAEVLLDDAILTRMNSGEDTFLKEGKSYVKVDGADMYRIVKTANFQEGVLKIKPFKGMRVYAYTFG